MYRGRQCAEAGPALKPAVITDDLSLTNIPLQVSPNPKTSPARDTPLAPPRLSLGVDSAVLGTAYVLNTPHHTPQVSGCVR
jgi:hypothetical protein